MTDQKAIKPAADKAVKPRELLSLKTVRVCLSVLSPFVCFSWHVGVDGGIVDGVFFSF